MPVKVPLLRTHVGQIIPLPEDVAFAPDVKEVFILMEGQQRVLVPADALWDAFFEQPGSAFPQRDQPDHQVREDF